MARNKYDVDEDLNVPFDFKSFKRMLGYMRPHWRSAVLALGLMILAALLGLAAPYALKMAIDDAIPHKNLVMLLVLAGVLFVAQALNAIFLNVRIKLMAIAGQDVVRGMRRDIFDRLQLLPFSYFDSRPHGKILIRVVNYVNSLSDLLSNGLIQLITDIFSIIFILAFMIVIDVRLTLVCMAGVPLFVIVILALKKRQRILWQSMSQKQSSLNAYLHERLTGVKVTQSFAREQDNQRLFTNLSELWRTSWIKAVGTLFAVWPVVEIVSVIGTCLVYGVGIFALRASVSVGVLVAFVGYVWRFWQPVINIGNFYNNLMVSAAYLERIFETIDEEVGICDQPGAKEIPVVSGLVEFDHVDFSYEEGIPVLKDISLRAEPGKMIAIVGPTGAGKTTIVNLLARFYDPQSGRILIDGSDLRELKISSVRGHMGIMLQDPFLFSGSIKENIRYGRLDASDQEISAAAAAVNAHDFIQGLANGYDTEVNERGARLSMGQRQLISFARAILANPAILVLDEATSSIDTETERLIQKGMETLLKGRTSFVIAHRLSTIRNADKILFVDHGRILESGNHAELSAAKGPYWKLYASMA